MIQKERLGELVSQAREILKILEDKEKDYDILENRYKELVKSNTELRKEADFYREAYKEQLQNNTILSEELEEIINKLEI